MNTKDDNNESHPNLWLPFVLLIIQFLIPEHSTIEKQALCKYSVDRSSLCAHNTTHHLSLTKVRYSATTVKYARAEPAFAKDLFWGMILYFSLDYFSLGLFNKAASFWLGYTLYTRFPSLIAMDIYIDLAQ